MAASFAHEVCFLETAFEDFFLMNVECRQINIKIQTTRVSSLISLHCCMCLHEVAIRVQ